LTDASVAQRWATRTAAEIATAVDSLLGAAAGSFPASICPSTAAPSPRCEPTGLRTSFSQLGALIRSIRHLRSAWILDRPVEPGWRPTQGGWQMTEPTKAPGATLVGQVDVRGVAIAGLTAMISCCPRYHAAEVIT
jgi:hypothetical protein